MLFSSSNRACNSISTATCLPRSAAGQHPRDVGITAGAIERELDGHDVGIVHRGLNEPLDRAAKLS
jgi:hypothetical protein